MTVLSPEQKEILRHTLLEIMALRHPTAHATRAICRRAMIEVDFTFDDEAGRDLLEQLRTLGLIRCEIDGLGSTEYWAATGEGVIRYNTSRYPRSAQTRE